MERGTRLIKIQNREKILVISKMQTNGLFTFLDGKQTIATWDRSAFSFYSFKSNFPPPSPQCEKFQHYNKRVLPWNGIICRENNYLCSRKCGWLGPAGPRAGKVGFLPAFSGGQWGERATPAPNEKKAAPGEQRKIDGVYTKYLPTLG